MVVIRHCHRHLPAFRQCYVALTVAQDPGRVRCRHGFAQHHSKSSYTSATPAPFTDVSQPSDIPKGGFKQVQSLLPNADGSSIFAIPVRCPPVHTFSERWFNIPVSCQGPFASATASATKPTPYVTAPITVVDIGPTQAVNTTIPAPTTSSAPKLGQALFARSQHFVEQNHLRLTFGSIRLGGFVLGPFRGFSIEVVLCHLRPVPQVAPVVEPSNATNVTTPIPDAADLLTEQDLDDHRSLRASERAARRHNRQAEAALKQLQKLARDQSRKRVKDSLMFFILKMQYDTVSSSFVIATLLHVLTSFFKPRTP